MADNPETPEPFSLKRWSQRKRAATQTPPVPTPPLPAADAPSAMVTTDVAPAAVPQPLPPVESLTFDSDYSAFMQPKIAEETKRAALRKLFSDPSFNVMDGLDIYVGDYTQSDPMPTGMLEKLTAAYAMLDPVEPAARRRDRCGRRRDSPQTGVCVAGGLARIARDGISGRTRAVDAGRSTPATRHRHPATHELRRPEGFSLLLQRHDAARWRGLGAGARASRRSGRAHDVVPARTRPLRRRRARRCRGGVHAGTASFVRRGAGRRQDAGDPIREHPRDRRLVERGARSDAQDRGAAGHGGASRPRTGSQRRLRVRRAGSDHRSVERGALLGGGAEGSPRRHRAGHRTHDGRGIARGACLSRVFGRTQGAGRMARRVRRGVDAGQSDRSRPLHALQCLHSCVSGVGHRLELPDRSRPLPRPSQVRRRVRRRRRDRLRSAGHATRRTLRSGLRPAREAVDQAAPAAAGLFRAGKRFRRPGQGWPWKSRR